MSAQKALLQKLLLRNAGSGKPLSAWLSLMVGCCLLFISLCIWTAFNDLLSGKAGSDSLGSTFLTISKRVDDKLMGRKDAAVFTPAEIDSVRNAPRVTDVGALVPANFKVAASLGSGNLSFYTLLFLEAAPDRFLDGADGLRSWHEGEYVIPIILSRDFLNMYNYVFAPSQGLPLLSEASVKALGFTLTVGEGATQKEYRAQVQGFSDRISSVLVPLSFIEYGNKTFAGGAASKSSRLILKVSDPADKAFVAYLDQHNLAANSEQLRFNKMRNVVEAVAGGTGALAVLLVGVSVLVFLLFIQLTLAKAAGSVKLLLEIGYSPKSLARFMTGKYMPMMLSAVLAALGLASLLQYIASKRLAALMLQISPRPNVLVFAAAACVCVLLFIAVAVSVRKALNARTATV